MPELIDKHAAYKALKHEADTHMLPESKQAYERAARIIDQMKPEVGQGRWIIDKGDMWCSECGYGDVTENGEPEDYRYCPNCGCCMEEDINNG